MRQRKLLVFFTVFSLILVFAFFLFNAFRSNVINLSKVKVEESFSTNEILVKHEERDETMKMFIEKAIEIEGEIKEITLRDGKYTVILKGDSKRAYILCEMQKNQSDKVLELTVGQKVRIKGVLKGFLIDVILLNCVIL